MPMTVSELQVKVSADTREAESGLASLGSKVSSVGGGIATAFGTAAIAGIAGLAAGLTASVSAAAGFEASMSAIKAVSGATGAEMAQLSDLALQLGADTSFSASEAAAGIGELIKAGVSIGDVMGGGAAAALNLAAAGGLSVAESAEIASNAMNVFSLKGADVGHVADVIAGAANASAIDVHDFGMSLSAAGAVAATVGIGFDDLGTAIAVMGQAGIKGSDAGTSLKTMLLNLTPSTKGQIAVAKELGIVTADGANKFFDASGKAKSLSEIAEVLQQSTSKLTEQQKLQALQTLFGTDAIRAAAIMAKAGAEGFDTMAESIGKVTAADVAKTRLDNLKGSIEQLKGSLETAGIQLGTLLLPGLKSMVDGLTEWVNKGIGIIKQLPGAWEDAKSIFNEGITDSSFTDLLSQLGLSDPVIVQSEQWLGRIGDAWRTMQQAFEGNWSPSAQIDPFVNSVGIAATKILEFKNGLSEALEIAKGRGVWDDLGSSWAILKASTGDAAKNMDRTAEALRQLGIVGGQQSDWPKALGLSFKVVSLDLKLVSLEIAGVVDGLTTLIAVTGNSLAANEALGRGLKALATGDLAGASAAFDDWKTAAGRAKDAASDWATNSAARVREGARTITEIMETESELAAAAAGRGMSKATLQIGNGAAEMQRLMEANGAGMVTAAETAGQGVTAATADTMAQTVTTVQTQAPLATAAVDAMGTGMTESLVAAGPGMATAAGGAAEGAVAAVAAQQGPASAAGSSVGDSMGAGMDSGLSGWLGSIAARAKAMVAGFFSAAREEADSHSPSKKSEKFADDLMSPIEDRIASSSLAAEMKAQLVDFISAARDYIPTAGEIRRVEGEIKDIRDRGQVDALWRMKDMVTIDSESLRLKQAQAVLDRDAIGLRQDLARATREVSDIERGSLGDRTRLIEMDGQRKGLRLQEIELEKTLLGLDPDSKKAKRIKEQIDALHLQSRELDLESEKTRLTGEVAATASKIKREKLDDQARGQQTVIDRIKDQIDVLGAEQAVFSANEAVIKNATDNEVRYRERLIAVFTAEGKPLADRITAGLALVDQLEKEGKISKELADRLRDVSKESDAGKVATGGLGSAAAVAAPQLDGAARKAEEMARASQHIAEQAGAADGTVSALAKSLGKLPDWFRPKGSSGGGGLFDPNPFKASGGPVAAGHPYIVGERRPELFVPNRSGTILPSVPMGGGGGSGPTQTHRFVIAGPDGRTLAEWHVRGKEVAIDLGLLPRGTS